MQQVARSGRIDFRRALQRETAAIKECLREWCAYPVVNLTHECSEFRGKLDPLRGDAFNVRVRDAAKEALEAVYDNSAASDPRHAMSSARMQGFGSTGGGGGDSGVPGVQEYIAPSGDSVRVTPGPPISSGRMTGFGNTSYTPDTADDGAAAKISGFVGSLKRAFTTKSGGDSAPLPASTGVKGYGFATNRGPNAYVREPESYKAPSSAFGGSSPRFGVSGAADSGSTEASTTTGGGGPGDSRSKGRVGGVWGSMGGSSGWGASPSQPASTGRVSVRQTSASGGSSGQAGGAVVDGSYERSLVEEVTALGGIRPVPTKDQLESFLRAAASLDAAVLTELLSERLQSEQWQVCIQQTGA